MKQNNLFHRAFIIALLACCALSLSAQKTDRDKKNADEALYTLLTSKHTPEKRTTTFQFQAKDLQATYDSNIFLISGTHFQIETLTNNFYVEKADGGAYRPVFHAKYPLESLVNLMLNLTHGDDRNIVIDQHLYGERKTIGPIPMANINELLAPTMQAYCNVTAIEGNVLKAILVYHQPKDDYIHMFIVETTTEELFKPSGTLKAQLYGNIPQSNLKNLFKKYRQP